MKVYVSVKQIAKKDSFIKKQAIEVSDQIQTLRDLIIDIVSLNVKNYNKKQTDSQWVDYLLDETIMKNVSVGKVGFGFHFNEKKAKEKQAIETAVLAFQDGIYRVFINEDEKTNLDELLNLKGEDNITFVRLLMLAGRLW